MPVETTESDAVRCEVRVEASPETIFPFFTDPQLAIRWMGTEASLDPQPGGTYEVLVAGAHRALGEYVELDPPRRIVFTWGWDVEDFIVKPGSSTVEIELVPSGEATLVRLTHSDLPQDSREPHAHGWTHYLDRLAIAAAGGDAGPDEGPPGPE